MRTIPLALCCLAALAGDAAAQQQVEAPETPVHAAAWQELVRRFDSYMIADHIVGGSMMLIDGARVTARHHAGYADLAARRPVDAATIFHYGSITKTLTAIGIMQLRDRGLLSLDDAVVSYLPELRHIHDPYGHIDDITIRMLLSHTAGFQNPTWPYRNHAWQPFEPTSWDQLVAMMPYQRLHFEPGSRYGYSNPAFIYLARIIEQLSGDGWQMYIQKNLFMPIGLQHSYFGSTPPHLAPHRSHGYDVITTASGRDSLIDNGADFDPGITIPNGGWNAPLEDMARYVAFLVRAPADSADYEPILARASLEEMWRGVVDVADGERMGLSFFVRSAAGREDIVGHTGTQAGYRSFLWFNPASDRAVMIVFNTSHDRSPGSAELESLLEQVRAMLREEILDTSTKRW